MEQSPFQVPDTQVAFADNPEPRCASLLLLDTSGSMQGEPLRQLQEGIAAYKDQLAADPLAKKRVEIGIVTFGGTVDVAHSFATVDAFYPPALNASGETPMARAVITGLDLLDQRKQEYKANGVGYFQPWAFLITDGAPTDANSPEWSEAIRRIRESEDQKKLAFFAVAVENGSMEMLQQLSKRAPVKLKGLRFPDLFAWLSQSQTSVSRSMPGDDVPIVNPVAPEGWATV